MAKGKAEKKKAGSVPNRSLYSRISFLHQAAAYLALPKQLAEEDSEESTAVSSQAPPRAQTPEPLAGAARRLAADVRVISMKTKIRLSPHLKQYACKHCDTVLIEGQSCTSTVENKSKGGKKPWADVLVRKCHSCGREKRFPVDAPRPKRKTLRGPGNSMNVDKTD